MSSPPLHYALLLFPQFEILDAFGPIEALNTLSHLPSFPHTSKLNFSIIAETLDPVSSGPLKGDPDPFNPKIAQSVVPTHTFADAPGDIDVLIVPGGWGAGPRTRSGFEPDVDGVVNFIRDRFRGLRYLITICNGSGLAARAGVLDGEKATTNKAGWDWIVPLGRKTHWVAEARWVESSTSKIWTSSGVSAGMDCFLAFLEKVYGKDEGTGVAYADQVCEGMEYVRVKDWRDDPFAKSNGVRDVLPLE